MKKYLSLISLLVLSLVSCTNEFENIFTGGEVSTINVSAEEFQTETRTSIENTNYSVKWNNGDMIGIFPMKENAKQIAFEISGGSGSSNASFDGNGWGLKNGTSYAAYYPLNRDALLDKTSITLDYTGQTQNGNGNSSHLGGYDFLKAASTQAVNGSLDLQFEHIGTLIHLTLDVPNGTYKKVELHSDGSFYSKAVLNLETGNTLPDEESETKTLTLNLDNISVSDGKLEILTMVYPVDLDGSNIYVYAFDEEGNNVSTTTWKGVTFQPSTVWNGGELKVIPYLTFKADKTQTLQMSKAVETLEYSEDGGEWQTLGTNTAVFGGSNGDLRLRGKSSRGTIGAQITFGRDVPVSCSGDIRTLVDYDNYATTSTKNASFYRLFIGCTNLTTAPELPATTLASNCYGDMFNGCTSLTTAPELPATTLARNCYRLMFYRTGIKEMPAHLRNTELVKKWIERNVGLQGLFAGLPVTDDYLYTILPVNSSGRYYLPTTTSEDLSYDYMFAGCTSLTTAPELPATTLLFFCYFGMFSGCTSLTTAPELPATTLASDCYGEMFSGCTSLTTAPELPATTLEDYCYQEMFYYCPKLNYIKMMATDISATNCLKNWTSGVSFTGTFVKNVSATWDVRGTSGIPESWTVIDEKPNSINGHAYLDLGITDSNGNKVLWATTNVGADNPWDYGNYYAWGETKAYGEEDNSNAHNYAYGNTYKKTYYSWDTYKWATGDSQYTLSKYSYNDGDSNGSWYDSAGNYVGLNGVKNQKKLDAEDDVATVNWGTGWRIPTYSELELLKSNCYWKWVTEYNGQTVSGYVIYKAKANVDKGYRGDNCSASYSVSHDAHIFLPAAGWRMNSYRANVNSDGRYWSAELYNNSWYARFLDFVSDRVYMNNYYRSYGLSVRPVYVKQN